MLMRAVMLVACALFAASCTTPATTIGTVHQGTIMIATRAVPLPPGEWLMLGDLRRSRNDVEGGLPGDRTILLTQDRGGHLAGLALLTATELASRPGYWTDAPKWFACREATNDLVPAVKNLSHTEAVDCRRATFWSPARHAIGGEAAAAWQEFMDRRRREPGWAPDEAVLIVFARADRYGVLQILYSFPTPIDHSSDTGRRVRAWMDAVGPLLATGFRIGGTTPAPAF
jgi:hypothetical protein